MALILWLAALLVAAPVDWWAVERNRQEVEQVAKPLVMGLLLIAVLVADIDATVSAAKWWFVAALICSLIGDVALLRYFDLFTVGLGAFLLAHIFYIVGILAADLGGSWLGFVGTAVVLVAVNVVGKRVADNAGKLQIPVWLYIFFISGLVIVAGSTGSALAFAGALFFYASDGLLGWGKFIGPTPQGRTLIHATYHIGQAGLVAWLVFS